MNRSSARVGWSQLVGFVAVAAVLGLVGVLPATATAAATSPPAVIPPTGASPGPQEVTGPIGTLPSGSFPPGIKVIAQLPKLRTAKSNTYLTSSGSRILMSYPAPINYQDSTGAFQPIVDTAVADSGGGWHNTAGPYQATVAEAATQPLTVHSAGASLGLSLVGGRALGATATLAPSGAQGSASHATVRFASPLPSTSLAVTFANTGVDESLSLASPAAPQSYTWSIAASAGLSASLTPAGAVAFKNAAGATAMVIDTPTIEDSHHLFGPTPVMTLSPDHTSVTISLAADATWLAVPTRAYPVIVDPTISVPESLSQCQLYQNGPTTSECEAGTSYLVGYNSLSANADTLFRFDNLASSIPYDSLVQNTTFATYEQGSLNTNTIPVSLGTIANKAWNPTTATWDYYDSGNDLAWQQPGGDFTTTPGTTTVTAGAANGWLSWYPIQQVQSWVNGQDLSSSGIQPQNQGFMLSAPGGASNCLAVTNWASSATSQWPYLSVTYVPRIGASAPLDVPSTPLDSTTTLGVNAANGDLHVSSSLFNIRGIGLPLSIGQKYDSMGAIQTSLGTGTTGAAWALSPSFDQPKLYLATYNPTAMDLIGSAGLNAVFTGQNQSGVFAPAPGIDATLAALPGSTFSLTFNHTGEVWTFSKVPADSGLVFSLTSMRDRNGDTISFRYNSPGTLLTSIVDTEGRTVTIAYNSDNLISSITDSTGRQVTYTYANPAYGVFHLASESYAGTTTAYGYDGNGNLDEITDPDGHITTIAYDSTRRVTSTTRVTDNATLAGDTTSYSYSPGSAASPGSGSTQVDDPNGHRSTYVYDSRDEVNKVTDANGNARSTSYNPNSQVATLTDAMSNPAVTSLSYDTTGNLIGLASPPSASGQHPATTTFGYATSSGVTGGATLPSSVLDAQGNCTSYTYDPSGNVASSTAGQPSNCSGTGSGSATNTYQGDGSTNCGAAPGELCSTTNANGATTNYGYANGAVTFIVPPAPLGATTIGYDALTRPTTVASPNGTATYYYNAFDRITQLSYGSGPTVSYVYDGDGNIVSRSDPSGTTTFTYDSLNRLVAEHLPGGADGCPSSGNGAIILTYDAASNLSSYCNGAGTTSYGYDPANRVVNLTEPGGSCSSSPTYQCVTFAYNANNQWIATTFPGGATENASYDPGGNQLSAVGSAASGGTPITSYAYSYSARANDTQLRQSMTEADAVANLTTSYSYDSQNRLRGAANSQSSTGYTYDPVGNRTMVSTAQGNQTFTYNAANQVTNGPAGSYSYNSSGGLIQSPQFSNLTYTTAAQTTEITPTGSPTASLSYAETGQALLTQVKGTQVANGPLGLDSTTTGGTTTYFIRDPNGTLIGERTGTNSASYFLKDALGSITALINGSGSTVLDRFSYDPYGNLTSSSGSTYEPFGFAGGYTTGIDNLVKFGARYYDPTTATWTQLDPTGQSQGYIYAGDNPVNFVDPSGAITCPSFIPGCGVVTHVQNVISGSVCNTATKLFVGLGGAGGADIAAAGVEATAAEASIAAASVTLIGGLIIFGAVAGGYLACH